MRPAPLCLGNAVGPRTRPTSMFSGPKSAWSSTCSRAWVFVGPGRGGSAGQARLYFGLGTLGLYLSSRMDRLTLSPLGRTVASSIPLLTTALECPFFSEVSPAFWASSVAEFGRFFKSGNLIL